ncbi:hypothetical protein ElyMa_000330600 [Elysia marginata]|uniref:Uncharacterized protein n=1 Tax=Elysia marginata TaxID=1093978 RepID=A0AAV4FCA7_9GAST|nr:hypothetical protein ElyMa_000330600 [Elysia marginata]
MSTEHNPGQLLCIVLNLLVVTGTSLVVVCSLANRYDFPQPIPDLLRHDLEETAKNKPSPISPAPWLYTAWAVVMGWQLLLALHAFFSICRKWTGVPVYTSPILLSAPLLLCISLACSLNAAWFVVYDREIVSTACLLAVLSMVLGWTSFGLSLYSLEVNMFRLRKAERYSEIITHRIIVHNGLALYAMWCVYVTAFNVAVAMMHNDQKTVDTDTSTVVAMIIMAVFMVCYFLLDVTCLDQYTRYTGTPYLVSIVVLSACFFRQDDWKSDDVNFIFLAGLLTFAFLSCMVKSACVLCRVMRPSTYGSMDVTSVSFRRATPEDEGRYLLK